MVLPIIGHVWCVRRPKRSTSTSCRCPDTVLTSCRSRPSGVGSGRMSPIITAIPPPRISAAGWPLSKHASIRTPALTDSGSKITSTPTKKNYASQGRRGLGSWQAASAYRVVVDLLGSHSEKVEWLLGDAVTATSHRVMFNLFDGDTTPIKGLLENPEADVYVRRRMFDLLGMLMLAGKLERDELAAYLRDLHGRLEGDPEGLVWAGWAELVAQVGLWELTDLVEESFKAGKIEPMFLSRTDFHRIMKDAEEGQVMQGTSREFEPFGDLVAELGDWMIRDDWDDEIQRNV